MKKILHRRIRDIFVLVFVAALIMAGVAYKIKAGTVQKRIVFLRREIGICDIDIGTLERKRSLSNKRSLSKEGNKVYFEKKLEPLKIRQKQLEKELELEQKKLSFW
jgi:hypothetical protein